MPHSKSVGCYARNNERKGNEWNWRIKRTLFTLAMILDFAYLSAICSDDVNIVKEFLKIRPSGTGSVAFLCFILVSLRTIGKHVNGS